MYAFRPGDFFTVGGVRIPHAHGLIAHSNGDVGLQALCDALIGAAALGEIGRHYVATAHDSPTFGRSSR